MKTEKSITTYNKSTSATVHVPLTLLVHSIKLNPIKH